MALAEPLGRVTVVVFEAVALLLFVLFASSESTLQDNPVMTKYPKSQICRQPDRSPPLVFGLRRRIGMVVYENLRANLRAYILFGVFYYPKSRGSTS